VAPDSLTHRERHLLALRFALPVLFLMAGVLGFFVPLVQTAKGTEVWDIIQIGFVTVVVFSLAYVIRFAFPNQKTWIEPGHIVRRPKLSWRASLAISFGVLTGCSVLAASLRMSPFVTRKEDIGRFLAAGPCAAFGVGILVYLFAATVFLPVRSTDEGRKEENLPLLSTTLLVVFWVEGIVEETSKHSFWGAVAMSTWIMATIGGSVYFAWLVYAQVTSGLPAALVWRPNPSKIPTDTGRQI
jgi:uncharacterized membrane protein YozB (DUF420 family)